MNTKVCYFLGLLVLTQALGADQTTANRISLSYTSGFLIDASFRNLASVAYPGGDSIMGSYTDGYVRSDSTGDAMALTSNWGFESPDQVTTGSLLLKQGKTGPLGEDAGSDFNHGFELIYGRYIAALGKSHWGIEGAFSFLAVDIDQTYQDTRNVLSVDGYDLFGIVPPSAPYSGSFESGPGQPLLTTTPSPVPVSVYNNLTSSLYGFKLGPFIEWPLTDRVTLGFGAGLSVIQAETEYSFTESYGNIHHSGEGSDSSLLLGGYASVGATISITQNWALESRFQFQGAESAHIVSMDKEAELNLKSGFLWTFGVRRSF